jgi:hypothetical protein
MLSVLQYTRPKTSYIGLVGRGEGGCREIFACLIMTTGASYVALLVVL